MSFDLISDLMRGKEDKPNESPNRMTVDDVLAAVLYDFAAFLTCEKTPITVGSSHSAVPMAEAVDRFITSRKINMTEDPNTRTWRHLANHFNGLVEMWHAKAIEPPKNFRQTLAEVLNRFSQDVETNTPDFVLAKAVDNFLGTLKVIYHDKADLEARKDPGQGYEGARHLPVIHGTETGRMSSKDPQPAMVMFSPSMAKRLDEGAVAKAVTSRRSQERDVLKEIERGMGRTLDSIKRRNP